MRMREMPRNVQSEYMGKFKIAALIWITVGLPLFFDGLVWLHFYLKYPEINPVTGTSLYREIQYLVYFSSIAFFVAGFVMKSFYGMFFLIVFKINLFLMSFVNGLNIISSWSEGKNIRIRLISIISLALYSFFSAVYYLYTHFQVMNNYQIWKKMANKLKICDPKKTSEVSLTKRTVSIANIEAAYEKARNICEAETSENIGKPTILDYESFLMEQLDKSSSNNGNCQNQSNEEAQKQDYRIEYLNYIKSTYQYKQSSKNEKTFWIQSIKNQWKEDDEMEYYGDFD